MTENMNNPKSASVNEEEIQRFSKLSAQWWDPTGPMAPLHDMNPTRVNWIKELVQSRNHEKLNLIDVGCGAGIASEAFARAGFNTLAVDASTTNIQAANHHLELSPLPPFASPLRYEATTAENILEQGLSFDVVASLEVIEHVNEPAQFVSTLSKLCKPNGYVAISTINRNPRSWVEAKLGAEYFLGLLPVGTHDWKQFVTPNELRQWGEQAGLRLLDIAGMSYGSPFWRITQKPQVNYITLFQKV